MQYQFQSTLPLRGATYFLVSKWKISKFQSTLPLRGATTRTSLPWFLVNFNPRSPYGERLGTLLWLKSARIFQSTLPLRGATEDELVATVEIKISIHAPLTGSDGSVSLAHSYRDYFNPRSPYGERRRIPTSQMSP